MVRSKDEISSSKGVVTELSKMNEEEEDKLCHLDKKHHQVT